MSVDIRTASRAEVEFSSRLREAVLAEIERRGLSDEQLAKVLGLPESGAYWLSLKSSWPLEVSVRVAEALELEFHLSIAENGNVVPPEARAA